MAVDVDEKLQIALLTALLVLMLILPSRYSKTFSKFPDRADRRKLLLPSF